MKILAIDVGLKTGWAIGTEDWAESAVENFTLKRGESKGMLYIYFRKWLLKMLSLSGKLDLVIFEQPFILRSGQAYEILYGMTTRIMEECDRAKVEYTSLSPSTLKKYATGKGNSNKEKMLEAARLKFGAHVEDHNHADALFMYEYAKENFEEEYVIDLTTKEK